jgi:signal transduction histidine kinase
MPWPERIARIPGSWRGDALVAAAVSILVLCYEVVAAVRVHDSHALLETCLGIAFSGSIIARRGHPKPAATAAAGCAALMSLGSGPVVPGGALVLPLLLLAYSLGTDRDWRRAALALAVLGVGVQVAIGPDGTGIVNPFVVVCVIGPWAVGLVVRSQRRLTEQLAVRGHELEAERELFAAEAVRYERARIARELHDIVAHCISVAVIQASAGQRLTVTDPSLAAEALDAIAEVVRQAETEIGRLVQLLDQDPRLDPRLPGADGMMLVDELVARATAARLAVSVRVAGSADGLSGEASEAAYRVVQEGMTNALKHAPGAHVDIAITELNGNVEIAVVNGPPVALASGLERAGGGNGLAGMRDRVLACGGELTAGPEDGGWQVRAWLPAQPG